MSKTKPVISSETQTRKPPPSTGDDFADSCFALEFIPSPDDRIGSRMDGLKEVPGLVKQGLLEEAWMILDTHHPNLKDLDFIYAFKALILQKNGQPEAAKKTLMAGLKSGRGKFLLYERLGFLSFETGHLSEAVAWWIKSIVAMAMLNRLTMWEPFLYLANVAKALAGETHFNIFMSFVTKLSPHGELCLDDTALKKINEQARGLSPSSILKAMDALYLHYLHQPGQPPGDPAFPEPRLPGHPNVPATRDLFSAFHSLFGEDKKNAWVTRLAVTVVALALILFLLQVLNSPKKDLETGLSPVEETKDPIPVSNPSDPAVQMSPEKSTAVEIKPQQTAETVAAPEDQVPVKGKDPFLKAKAKPSNPDIKKKD